MHDHDIIVIGASAGGIEALKRLCHQLPRGLPASLCVVLHTSPDSPGLLAQILQHETPLPVVFATDRMPLTPGTIHLAPPDRHMLVDAGLLRVERGPRENLNRPSIDPLFRSAADSYGPRVVGVVLTGMLHDGTAGLQAVKAHGGITMVQDPAEAAFPSMPLSALNQVEIDHCLPLDRLAAQLVELAGRPAAKPTAPPEGGLGEEAAMARGTHDSMDALDRLGRRSAYSCPDCGGVLWELDDEAVLRFRCHVGHAYTAECLQEGKAAHQEQALWTAVRALEEQHSLLMRMAKRSQQSGHGLLEQRYRERAQTHHEEAGLLRGMLRRDRSPWRGGYEPEP